MLLFRTSGYIVASPVFNRTIVNNFIRRRHYTQKMSPATIKLSETEQKIRNLLVEYSTFHDQQEEHTDPSQNVILRFTGGWVRDKLLGLESHDLDIAINNMTGLDFAEGLKEYIIENASRLEIEPRSVHKIEKNPDKSKHLETATTKLYGLDVDFVNLRSEEYTDDSRIPKMKFGTPSQDAFRRDATLNALFYNLQDQKVEDFTSKGLEDLKNGILRTPLPPFETFRDDPLRVLRLIRFTATFGLQISPDALKAMQNPEIKLALIQKISRERVGVEISKLLAGKYAYQGLQHISNLQLEDSIFHFFDGFKPMSGFVYPESNLVNSIAAMDMTVTNKHTLPIQLRQVIDSPQYMPLLWLSAILNRWKDIPAIDKNKEVPSVLIIIREGLKLPVNDGRFVAKILNVQPMVSSSAKKCNELTRKQLGIMVRSCGEHWPVALVHSLAMEGGKTIDRYINLVKTIEKYGVEDAWSLRPLVNGKEIRDAFEVKRGDTWLSTAVELVVEYQLENPQASKDDCLRYILTRKDELLYGQE